MPRLRRILYATVVALSAAAALPAAGAAEVRLEIVETDPAPPAVLGHWEQFSLRVAYQTDRPVRLRSDAFFGGRRVTSITGVSPRLDPGTGEALIWFAYREAAEVDQIVVWAEDEQARTVLTQTQIDGAVRWTGVRPAVARTRAEWVERLIAVQEARRRAEMKAHMNRPVPWWELVIFAAMGWSAPGYLVVQGITLWRLRGGWRLAAMIPALPMAGVLVYTVYAFMAGSNLFPLVLLFTSPVALLYLVVLLVVRWLARRR